MIGFVTLCCQIKRYEIKNRAKLNEYSEYQFIDRRTKIKFHSNDDTSNKYHILYFVKIEAQRTVRN